MRAPVWFAACVCVLAFLFAASSARAAAPGVYVALGDSYTSGAGIPTQLVDGTSCGRSTANYPSIVAQNLGVGELRDASCSAATTGDMTAPQAYSGVAQFHVLTPDVDLVTLGIGFNDAALGEVLITCLQSGLLDLAGTACRDRHAPGGNDAIRPLISAAAPRVGDVLRGIHERSPQARVIVVGYPDILPAGGQDCWPLVSLSRDDGAYINGLVVDLNAMLARQAAANDAEFADTYGPSVGHDMCAASRWTEGSLSTSEATPLHPNAAGHRAIARVVLDVFAQSRPAPVLSDLRVKKRRLKSGRRIRFSFTSNRVAALTLTLQRRSKGSSARYSHTLRKVRSATELGANVRSISARGIRKLGVYRLTAIAATSSARSARQTVQFRVVR